jgi:PTS system fructose-specific IIC component
MIHELLNKDQIILNLSGATKEDILKEFIASGHTLKLIDDEKEFFNRILELENLGSSALEKGIAIPHLRDNFVKNLFLLIGITRSGVDFDSIDGESSRIIFFIGAKKNDKAYLPLLSRISRMCSYKEIRESFLNAGTPGEIMDIISRWEE